MSDNPDKRQKEMQTGSPHELIVVARLCFDSRKAAYNCEQELHRRLRKFHYRGEWFKQACEQELFKIPDYKKIKRWAKNGFKITARWKTQEELENDKLIESLDMEILSEARNRI